MAKRAKSINIDADPSSEFDFDGPNVPLPPDSQRALLKIFAKSRGGNMAAARKAFEESYGYKPTV
ncbi:MAG: hypothetical protein LBQ90_08890 [Synergistaceae bacterium]|nr:hypothetical protein [Synergistaceae bacterium]